VTENPQAPHTAAPEVQPIAPGRGGVWLAAQRLLELLAQLAGPPPERRALAALRRSLSFPPGEDPAVYRWVEPITGSCNEFERRVLYLVAGLFAFHPSRGDRSLAAACGEMRRDLEQRDAGSSFEQHFLALLDADADQLSYRLRQMISLLRSDELGFDWAGLAQDLRRWGSVSKRVQQAWARDFYRSPQADQAEASTPSSEAL
jgi:CRISPR system Cascade subunit CasB